MDSAHLIVKCAKPYRNDVKSLCREVFADKYKKHYNTDNLNNLVQYRSECDDIKLTALAVNQMHLRNKLSIHCIEEVENHIVLRNSEFFMSKELIEESDVLKERLRLKSWQAISDLPQEDVNKYGLLQKNDILPNVILQTLDFTKTNCAKPHRFSPCCAESINLSMPDISNDNILPEITNKSLSNATVVKLPYKEYEPSFRVLPEPYVVFYNYDRKTIYKKVLHLQNTSNCCSNSILLIEPPATPYFKVSCFEQSDSENNKIAPGLSVRYCVTFKCDFYINLVDKIIFRLTTHNCHLPNKQYDSLTVPLCSYRDAPLLRGLVIKASLNMDKFTLYSNFSKKRAKALCETIDCGQCFQGDMTTAHLVMRNYGSTSTFALITEMEWFHSAILNLTIHNELVLPSFVISPAYFTLKCGEYIDVVINFGPKYFGLYCESLYMLSDNNTAEQLDLVADGIMFSRCYIEVFGNDFEVVDNTETNSTDAAFDAILDFGICLFGHAVTKQMTLSNTSCIQLNYRFALEECMEYDEFSLPNDWITINTSGLLSAFGTAQVDVTLRPGHRAIGSHIIKLILIAENIPDSALDIHSDFFVIETYKNILNTQMLDIQMFTIKMTCTIRETQMTLAPTELSLTLLPDVSECTRLHCHIRFQATGSHTLHCKWTVPRNSDITIEPSVFELMSIDYVADEFQDCYFLIAEETLKRSRQLCILTINDKTEIKFDLSLTPSSAIPPDLPNWSVVQLSQANITQPQNFPDPDMFSEIDFYMNMLYVSKECTLETSVENASYGPISDDDLWSEKMKQLHTSISFADEAMLEEKYLLHSSNSCFNIVFVPELLYIGQVWRTQICLHNYTQDRTTYLWTNVTGNQRDMLDIDILPQKGNLRPLSRTRFDVYIKAKMVGIVEEIYLNCSIGKGEENLETRVMCTVEDMLCKIILPNDEENKVIFWPLLVKCDCQETRISNMSIPVDITFAGEATEAQSHTELLEFVEDDVESAQSEESGNISEYREAVPPPSFATMAQDEASTNFTTGVMQLFDKLSLGTADLTGMSLAWDDDISSKSLKGSTLRECFDENDLMVQEYVIEFKEIKVKTLVKKTIVIENLTPLSAVINSEVINFPGLFVEESQLDRVLKEFGYKKNSYWDEQLDSQGILIKPIQGKRIIATDEKLEIDIYVYADTYGIYADELLIEINDIPPFCVTILVEIVGCPIEFPMALNSIHHVPVLRFGCVHYKAHDITRSLRMYNASSIPVTIFWHILIKDKSHMNEEFNVLFDLHGKNTPLIEDSENFSPDGEIIITRRYYGSSNQNAFKIYPTESIIDPKTYLDMKITFSCETYSAQSANLNLEAYLLGYIYLSESYISQSFLYTRPYGKHLSPIKVLLTSVLELPQLTLNSICIENRFKFYASEIYERGGISQTKTILFKNNHSTTAKVKMTADPPFNVVAMKTRHFEVIDEFIAVDPDEVLQVTIRCNFTLERIKEMAKLYFCNVEYEHGPQSPSKLTTSAIKSLHIEQRATTQQAFLLDLIVLFPRFEFSVEQLEFGYCLIGTEKMRLVTLFNPLGCVVPFRIEPPNDIYVLPSSGLLSPCTASGRGYIDIKIFFVPRTSGLFKDSVIFHTNLSDYTKILGIYAVGSCDTMYQ